MRYCYLKINTDLLNSFLFILEQVHAWEGQKGRENLFFFLNFQRRKNLRQAPNAAWNPTWGLV